MDDLQFWGFVALCIWLIPSPISWIISLQKDFKHKKEYEGLKEFLNSRMEIEASGLNTLKADHKKLQEENENLRITIKALQNKPNTKELRQLYIYDDAIKIVLEKFPAGVTMWQDSLKEAEKNMENRETGLMPWVSRVFGVGYRVSDSNPRLGG